LARSNIIKKAFKEDFNGDDYINMKHLPINRSILTKSFRMYPLNAIREYQEQFVVKRDYFSRIHSPKRIHAINRKEMFIGNSLN